MKVVFINISDIKGGASIVANRLRNVLAKDHATKNYYFVADKNLNEFESVPKLLDVQWSAVLSGHVFRKNYQSIRVSAHFARLDSGNSSKANQLIVASILRIPGNDSPCFRIESIDASIASIQY